MRTADRTSSNAGNTSFSLAGNHFRRGLCGQLLTGLFLCLSAHAQITLTWDDNSDDETGFKIERATSGGAFGQIATVSANVVTYVDTTVAPATAYSYRVRAFNAAGDSAYSNAVTNAPAITSQPVPSQSVAVFGSATFAVVATGTPLPTYQWRRDGTALPGATNATLTLTNISALDAGTYTVVVANGIPNSVTSSNSVLNVTKANQTVSFGTLPGRTFGEAPFSLSATASSGLPVSFTVVSGPATISGNTVTLTGAGTVTLRASQPGDSQYNAAANVDQSFVVAKANQTISFAALPGRTFGDAPFVLTASASSALAVSFAVVSGPATISGNTLTLTGVGTVVLRASQTGNANYNAATTVDQSFAVVKGTPVLAWSTPAAITFGTALSGTQLNATSSVPGTFTYTPAAGTVLNAGSGQLLSVVFSPTDAANYNSAAASTLLTVNKAAQTITFSALADRTLGDSSFVLAATATSGLPVTYTSSAPAVATVSGNTVTIVGVGSTTISASQAGSANFDPASTVPQVLTVNAPAAPIITAQPAPVSVLLGGTAVFTVAAAASPAPQYQWRKNGTNLANGGNISGATTATLTLTSVATADAGSYSVVVSNGNLPNATSASALLTVNLPAATPPTIVTPPASQTVAASATATFSVIAFGADLAYQWRKDGANLPGANASTLTVASATAASAGSYSVVVSNSAGSVTSSAAVLTVQSVPAITTQPIGQTVVAPAGATFSVVATGAPTAYQWRKDGASLAGATGSSLALATTTLASAGSYSVVVSNSLGSVTSNPALLTVETAPAITSQPAGQTVVVGSNASFSVSATGVPAPTFQWRRNGAALPGATGSTLPLASVTLESAGAYTVMVTNPHGTVTSAAAQLQVNQVSVAGSFFGTFSTGGSWALHVRADNTATFIAHLPDLATAIVTELTVAPDGTFSVSGTSIATIPSPLSPSSLTPSPPRSAAPQSFTFSGQISGGQLSGQVLGRPVSAAAETGSGTAAVYRAPALLTATGTTYSIVGPSGRAVVVMATPTLVDGGIGTVGANGQLNVTTAGGAQLALTVGADTGAISATYVAAGSSTPLTFGGVPDTVRTTSALANLSIRSTAGGGNQTLIAGFAVTGGSKAVLIRGIGPALAAFGVTGTLPDPRVDLFGAGASTAMASNDNWAAASASTFSQVGAFALTAGSRDAALVTTLSPGTYSAHVTDVGGGSGIALLEVYDTAVGGDARLVNASARAQVGTGGGLLILGFNVTGAGPRTLLIRAVGPTLSNFGLTGTLADPRLDLYASGATTPLAGNDNWENAQAAVFTQVGAFALPAGSRDAALRVTLNPGSYTAHVAGVGNTTGVALVEIYEVP